MSFIEEIKNMLGIEEDFFKVLLIGEGAMYVEGVKSVVKFSSEEIILRLKKGEIKILGKEMFIKKYCGGDLAICGKIISFTRS